MIVVYSAKLNVDNFQCLLPTDSKTQNLLDMSCVSLKDDFHSANLKIPDKKLRAGDFFNWMPSYFIVTKNAQVVLKKYFDQAGETIPFKQDDNLIYYINILQCIDCLDETKSRLTGPSYQRRQVFIKDKLPQPGLFKVPQMLSILISVDEQFPAYQDFLDTVRTNNLSGLIFTELWRG